MYPTQTPFYDINTFEHRTGTLSKLSESLMKTELHGLCEHDRASVALDQWLQKWLQQIRSGCETVQSSPTAELSIGTAESSWTWQRWHSEIVDKATSRYEKQDEVELP